MLQMKKAGCRELHRLLQSQEIKKSFLLINPGTGSQFIGALATYYDVIVF